MREGIVYSQALKPAHFPAGLRLRNLEWGVLFAINGTTPVGVLQRTFSLSSQEIEQICNSLLEHGLIREKEVSLSEYMAAQTAAYSPEPVTLLELLQGVSTSHTAPVTAPAPATQPAPSATPALLPLTLPATTSQVTPSPSTGRATAPVASATFSPSSTPMHSERSTARRLSLKKLNQFIIERAPDLTTGQLDIYRIFIRVNTRLLKRNGIHSFTFEEDRIITDAELQQEITQSVQQTTGSPCPEQVFI